MRTTPTYGVFGDKGFLWTMNRTPGVKTYGEKLRAFKGKEYRNWNPFRSKVCALIKEQPDTPWLDFDKDVLYLGASTGTTVSHVSDLLRGNSVVYAVEFSSRSMRDLLWNMEARSNVVPILGDAGKPEEYAAYVDQQVGAIIQDVAQRHQLDIFLRNLPFLESGGLGFLFVKARSISVAADTKHIYKEIRERLREENLEILVDCDLHPFEKDHRAFVIKKP